MENLTKENISDLYNSNNNTLQHSNATSPFAFSKTTTIFYYAAFSLMFVVGTIGNSIVMYIITIKKVAKKTNFDIYILSLAVADLLASIFLPVVMIHDLYTKWHHWHLAGDVGCKTLLPMPHINSLVSALMLIVISFDRLRIIKQTSLTRRKRYLPKLEVLIVWVVSIAIVSPYVYVLRVEKGICSDQWKGIHRFIYYSVLQCFSCFLPIICMAVTYTFSAYILFHKKVPCDSDLLLVRRRRKQNQKVTQMFGTIVIIFFLMTTPYMISFFIIAYYGTFDEQTYYKNERLLFHLQYAFYTLMGYNATFNPLIYAVRYNDIRRTFRKVFSTQRHGAKVKRKKGVGAMVDRKYGRVSQFDQKFVQTGTTVLDALKLEQKNISEKNLHIKVERINRKRNNNNKSLFVCLFCMSNK